jgi:glutamyl-Q tRNA(Asp) synthetase
MPVFVFPVSLMRYRGRFAPSPTGSLHFGSLVAALGSYLDARYHEGAWLVRIEDVDRAREVPGSSDLILRTLDAFGFEWDEAVEYQSRRETAYREAVEQLQHTGLLYPCGCSRKDIRLHGRPGIEGPVYAGTCRNGLPPGCERRTLRVRTEVGSITVDDRIQGRISQRVDVDVGDFVVHRADGLFAYQLAVVVDDAWQDITHVVRGADLLLSTPRQIYLQRLLGQQPPEYAHLPLAVDRTGRKLSKQLASQPVDAEKPMPALLAALEYLDQPLPPEPLGSPAEILTWAVAHWDTGLIPPVRVRLAEAKPLLK